MALKELSAGKVVVFEVHNEATKVQIKEAVEEFFNVKVADVKTMKYQGKVKRFGRTIGRRKDWKKAIVTLQGDSQLDLV